MLARVRDTPQVCPRQIYDVSKRCVGPIDASVYVCVCMYYLYGRPADMCFEVYSNANKRNTPKAAVVKLPKFELALWKL